MTVLGTRWNLKWLLALLAMPAAFLFFPASARAGGDEVVVVYNSALPESREVAEYYARARQVPTNQVFGFSLATGEDMSRTDFKLMLQQPLADALEARGLWKMGDFVVPYNHGTPKHTERRVASSKIRYLVLCYGVPVRVSQDDTLHEFGQDKALSEFKFNGASVDSELAWLPRLNLHPALFGPMRNEVYSATNEASMSPTNGILLVTRLDGPSPEIARGLVDKAMAAERDGLWGRAYFDLRGLPPGDKYFYGDKIILGAALTSLELGFEVAVDTNAATFSAGYPLSQVGIYCGWYDGDVSGPFTLPHVEFMPGAFAYHLHSFSAADIRSTTRNWVGPLLAKGATCTMGCVSEPYLTLTPDVSFFFRAWAHGWSFGEAAWAGQPVLSWQTTVVGDPLYRPFAGQPLQLFRELQRRKSPWLEWAYLRLLDLDRLHGAQIEKLVQELEQLDITRQSAVLTEKLGDLVEAQGKPDAAIDYYQLALKRNPSPEQRIRLQLTLGSRLAELHRTGEARDDYQQLLLENPGYADRAKIEEYLSELAGLPPRGKP